MPDDPRVDFIKAATWHGPLAPAEAILSAHPTLATTDIHVAAILGDVATVKMLLASDPAAATRRSPPFGGDPLTYLCLSKYLRFDKSKTGDFVAAATALLDAGADATSGFWWGEPHREFETALYGAAGVAHNGPLTALLLQHGADPNDVEAVYHSPETDDVEAMKALVETGKVTPENLGLMLIRKHDWHDYEGARYLLEHGADPTLGRDRGWSPLHHAIARNNGREMVALLLDHGADPRQEQDGLSAIARAARKGRGDLLELFHQREIAIALTGVDRLIAACARGASDQVHHLSEQEPGSVGEVLAMGGELLAEFAGTWNTEGAGLLLDLGVPVDARHKGDGYFDLVDQSTALHVAAWMGMPSTVKLLIARGATIDARDAMDRTPLMLAVKATVDSYWTYRRSPETVRLLLDAGASVQGVRYPCGYQPVDDLLRSHGAV